MFVSCEQVIAYNKFPGIVILLGQYTLSIFIASFGDFVWFVLFPLLPFHFIVNKESLLETRVILSLEERSKTPTDWFFFFFFPVCLQNESLGLLFLHILRKLMSDIKAMLIWNN